MTTKNDFIPKNIIPKNLTQTITEVYGHTPAAALLEIPELHDKPQDRQGFTSLLTVRELQRLDSFKLAKRQNEFLAGRICAKLAIAGFCATDAIDDLCKIQIDNAPDGRPYATFCQLASAPPHVHISISHSQGLAAALASQYHCGIDVQKRSSTLLRIQNRFCGFEEDRLLQLQAGALAHLDRLNLLWCAKEAIRKTFSHQYVPGFLQFHCTEIVELENEGYLLKLYNESKNQTVTAICTHYLDYAVAACLHPGPDHA